MTGFTGWCASRLLAWNEEHPRTGRYVQAWKRLHAAAEE